MENLSSIEHRKLQVSIGGTVILISFAMLFATLFLGYAIYRFSNSTWPPQGFEEISILWPSVSTLMIVLSSVFLELSFLSFKKNKMKAVNAYWLSTFLMSFLFIASQFFVWRSLDSIGIFYHSGILGSILHGFTWIHVGHVALGLLALLFLRPITKLKSFEESAEAKFDLIKKFWHFLGVVWIIMYIGLFLL